jgi:predicted transposase YdaD
MSQTYDPVLKVLVETEPQGWPDLLGLPAGPVTVIDSDVSSNVIGAVDKVLQVRADPEYLLHIDFQAGHDSARFPRRLRLYNTVLDDRHEMLVRSVAVILRPEADSPQLSGLFERRFPGEEPYAIWRYYVMRVWQVPPERFLAGPIGLLPLAPISKVTDAELPEIIRMVTERFGYNETASELWVATRILLGLRHPIDFVDALLQGVMGMRDSATYRAIVEEGRAEGLAAGRNEGRSQGRAEGALRILLLMGGEHLGPPDDHTYEKLEKLRDVELLEMLARNVSKVNSWKELLRSLAPARRYGRRRPS